MRNAFTLIELMIVISIIVIIASIAIPNILEHKKKSETTAPIPVTFTVTGTTYTVNKITIEGHMYMFIETGSRHGWNVVHDPDCSCLKPLNPLQVEKPQ